MGADEINKEGKSVEVRRKEYGNENRRIKRKKLNG